MAQINLISFRASTVTVSSSAGRLRPSPSVLPSSFSPANFTTFPEVMLLKGEEESQRTVEEVTCEEDSEEMGELEEEELDAEMDEEELEKKLKEAMEVMRREKLADQHCHKEVGENQGICNSYSNTHTRQYLFHGGL